MPFIRFLKVFCVYKLIDIYFICENDSLLAAGRARNTHNRMTTTNNTARVVTTFLWDPLNQWCILCWNILILLRKTVLFLVLLTSQLIFLRIQDLEENIHIPKGMLGKSSPGETSPEHGRWTQSPEFSNDLGEQSCLVGQSSWILPEWEGNFSLI